MTGRDLPHVQVRVDVLDILRLFRQPSHFIVFAFIGVFDADPLGASKRDILDYTGLSRPTVEEALRFLEREEYITFAPETRRYRCAHYFRFQGSEKRDLRELVPVRVPVKNSLTGHVVCLPVQSSPDSLELEQTNMARKIFDKAGVQGPNLARLAAAVAPELAQAWAEWLPQAPPSFTDPIGYMVKRLTRDAHATPPQARGRQLGMFDECRWATHGTREHDAFIRANPGWFDCACAREIEGTERR